MILILKQTLQSGKTKTWKLRPVQGQYSFGASRLADIISLDPQSPGIEGLFLYQQENWFYVPMTESVFNPGPQVSRLPVTQQKEIKLGSSLLHIETINKEVEWANKIVHEEYSQGDEDAEILIVKRNGKILTTRVFSSSSAIEKEIKDIWSDPVYEVIRKKIKTQSTLSLSKIGMDDIVDKESQRQVAVVLGLTTLLVVGGLFGPKSTPQMVQVPKKTQSIVIRTEVKPKEKIKEEKAPQAVAQKQVEIPMDSSKPSGRVADKVKNLAGGRISQLLGKVSAQAAKSANIFVGQGTKAGSGNSGRAMASIGAINRGGNSFGTGSGDGVTVSTAGRGGGRAVSGMGGLAAGRTGNGGVGLIEEESEISGGLDREVIAAYIKSQLGNILYCYERQLSAQPDLFGKVAVKFTIGPTGGIEARSIGDSTLKNATVEGCILQKVAGWKFPSPQGGTRVLVTYPFLFKSTN